MRIFLLIPFAIASFFLGSCGDSCRRTSCGNGGYCYEGECICSKWYSGDDCQLQFNRNYEGSYSGEVSGLHGPMKVSIELTADEDVPNRLNADYGFFVEFQTDSTLVLPVQTYATDNDTIIIRGLGEVNLGEISVRFFETESDSSTTLENDEWFFDFSGTKVIED